jgi:hypothetical protein
MKLLLLSDLLGNSNSLTAVHNVSDYGPHILPVSSPL